MEVVQFKINNRWYLVDEEGMRVKSIPAEYRHVAHKLEIQDYDKKRLTLNERLQLELMTFMRRLEIEECYVFEILKNRVFRSIRFVRVKFGDDRYEALFDGMPVVCPKKLFTLARRALYPFSEIKSMS